MGDLVASDMLIFIERCVFSKGNRDRISFAVEAPPVFTPSHMGTIMAIWDSAQTGGSREREICKRNSKTFLKINENRVCGSAAETKNRRNFEEQSAKDQ